MTVLSFMWILCATKGTFRKNVFKISITNIFNNTLDQIWNIQIESSAVNLKVYPLYQFMIRVHAYSPSGFWLGNKHFVVSLIICFMYSFMKKKIFLRMEWVKRMSEWVKRKKCAPANFTRWLSLYTKHLTQPTWQK